MSAIERDDEIRQPSRVIVGYCPACRRVLVVENEYGVWPYIVCACGWDGDTEAIADRARFVRGEGSPPLTGRDVDDRRAADDDAAERQAERDTERAAERER